MIKLKMSKKEVIILNINELYYVVVTGSSTDKRAATC